MKGAGPHPASLRITLIKFIAVMAVVSGLAGYGVSQLLFEMNDVSARRSVQLLQVEELLDEAAITLAHQIQEWKDMLLRADNEALYSRHLEGFKEASIGVQYALLNAKRTMQTAGMETADIDHLMAEHKSVLAEYLVAYSKFNPTEPGASNEADRRIMGVDRNLQMDMATVKAGISAFAKRQLSGTSYAVKKRYWMFGLLGAVCLLLMAVLGFAVAYRLVRRQLPQ